jgi:hypothetical protein
MVHALEEIHRLLRPGGLLIDIHPTPAATHIEVHHGGAITFSAPVPGQTFQDIRYAEDALARVLDLGMFTLQQAREFEWRTYAASVEELRDFIAWESAYDAGPSTAGTALEEGDFAGLVREALLAAGEGSEVARLYRPRIARLVAAGG